MKSRIAKSLSITALAFSLAACSSVSLDDSASGSGSNAKGANGSGVLDPFNPSSVLATNRSVYFQLNSFTVDSQYKDIVGKHTSYLVANPKQTIVIEGNTDARGSTEYNLALGQRRADAVRRIMTLTGARDAQIEVISFGKEKPKALGDTEADYAENRRADIVYKRPQ
jgi:peptidoglycan-associated lipoprotein|tara:strand:+ start:1729 stop:2232 length:504 start_codon:yes stop_codon:yes gene_type:complete